MERREYVRSRYGENHPITGDYDKSLAVKCINGTYVGRRTGDVIEFKGIPFVGEQPVGANRFKKPVPFQPDDGVYEAYYYAKVAVQGEDATEEASYYPNSEACLYLNVWKNTADETPGKPVMVWIHGGAFQQGGTADPLYDGLNFAQYNGDVILVTITYRVGILGFVRLDHLPGGEEYPDAQNLGLLDEVMALKWVYENIANFGGDPEQITIFGESAGGASVTLLPLIPEAQKYIHRVIAQSGTPVFTRSKKESLSVTDAILEMCECTTAKELAEISTDKLIAASDALPLRVWPERDGVLLPTDPYEAYAQGAAKEIDILQGCNKDELGYFVHGMGGPDIFAAFFLPRIEKSISGFAPKDEENARAIMAEEDEPYRKASKLGDQTFFIAPVFRISENHTAAGGRTYHYYFRVESSIPDILSGHGVELVATMGNIDVVTFTGRKFDAHFCHAIQRMWVNFAKTGNPSLTKEESPVGKELVWEEYNQDAKPIMVFDEFDIHPSTEGKYRILDWERAYPLTKYYLI